MVRALASHQCGPGSNPGVHAICGLSLLLVLSFAPRGFSPGTPVFPSPQKPTFPNSNSTRNQVDEEPLCGCATSKSLFIYLFIYLFFNFQFPVPRFSNIHLWMPCVPRQPMWLVTIQSTLTKYFWLRFCAASYRWFIIRFWETAHLPFPYRSCLKWHPSLRPIPNRLAARWGLGRRDGCHLRLLSFIMIPVVFHVGTRSHSV